MLTPIWLFMSNTCLYILLISNPLKRKIKAFLRQNRTYYSQTIGDRIVFDMYEITEK